jgi:hypothetical protein
MSSTTYPNIIPREDPMRPEHHSLWLLPDICTHLVCMTVIFLIILLYCELSLMHQLLHNVFPYVLGVWEGAFTKIDHDATKNVIARAIFRYTTLPSFSTVNYRPSEFQSHPCCHTCDPPVYNYFWVSPLPIRIVNCWEHLCLSISTVLN